MYATESASEATPLAVDLDGTLIRTDLFLEAMLRFLFAAPWKAPLLILWLLRGRAYAKARLAEAAPTDVAVLPYDERVVAWLTQEKAEGRTIVLATAADEREARRVADHLGLFDDVFASDGAVNLKSARKAERLAKAFPQGFIYAGNETADLKVWKAAAGAVVANTSNGLAKRIETRHAVEKSFPRQGNPLRAFVKAIRPQQWAKNVLVFLPLLVSQNWYDPQAWTNAVIAFFALSFTASSVYLVNDASDIEADRRHHRKRNRPFASGALSPVLGLVASIGLIVAGFSLGAMANVVGMLAVYLVSSTLYTFWLKRVVLIDVFLLASLYTIRVVLGGVATGQPASGWLLAFSCFFFLSLALVKRVAEVETAKAKGAAEIKRRGYFSTDGTILKMMGVGAGFVAALVLALYLQDDLVAAAYSEPFMLWALPGAIVFWVCRLWLMTERGEMHDDPLIFAFRDKTSLAIGALTGLAFIAAVIMPPNLLPV
jgi:4-hydroxybenzoate polyprenyltransferase